MRRARTVLLSAAALAAAIPALAQDQTAAPPAAAPVPSTQPQAAAPQAAPSSRTPSTAAVAADELPDVVVSMEPPVELPDHARRDPAVVGWLDPVRLGLGRDPWNGANGVFLSTLMRRLDTPIASRWTHIALRNAVLSRVRAPGLVNPVDWAAERAWLLLRMGEADAARMIVSGVDVDRFTPKMFQIGVQSALANADPSGLCPLQDGLDDVEEQVLPLIDAMCDALAGEPETAGTRIDSVRRRGEISPIDIVLAEKIVGATADTRRAVTVEWEPVEQLNSWRFGLATATGMSLPERLINAAPPRIRAWQAQAPLIAPADRLESAMIAAGLGVFSSQALIDLHSLIYDSTGPDELPETEAWQIRQAFIGENQDTRLAAMRRLWSSHEQPLQGQAALAMLGRAAARVQPSSDLEADAVNLVASMLAAGFDRAAGRWAGTLSDMDDDYADPVWAMLALGAPNAGNLDLSAGRIEQFIDRDSSAGRKRSALLVAGLAGLGRIDSATANSLNRRFGLQLARQSSWTRAIDSAAARRQAGTVLLLTGTGFQAEQFDQVPAAHLFRSIAALKTVGQDYTARMIAAEALART